MATIKFKSFGSEQETFIQITKYMNNRLALMFICTDYEPWGTMTVNIPDADITEEDEACIDTNNWPDAEEIISEYKLGEPTGKYARSGYCTYPIYKFDMNTVMKYTE
jgi:hypothetical protein